MVPKTSLPKERISKSSSPPYSIPTWLCVYVNYYTQAGVKRGFSTWSIQGTNEHVYGNGQ